MNKKCAALNKKRKELTWVDCEKNKSITLIVSAIDVMLVVRISLSGSCNTIVE